MILDLFKKKKLKTFKSCKTLWMRNFYEILDTNDFRWLLIDFDENSDIELDHKQKVELEEQWKVIFNDYVELKGDKNIIDDLRKRAQIANLQNRMFFGVSLLNLLIKNPKTPKLNEIIDELAEWKFRIDKKQNLSKEVEKIVKQLKAVRTRINIELSKYKEKQEKYKKQEKHDINDQTINIAKILDLKYPILTSETTVSQWLSYCKNANNVIKQQKKKNG